MAETPPTPSTPKTATKPEQFTPPVKSGQPRAEKADQTEATKTGRAAVKADQPVPRLLTVTITIDADSAEIVRVEGVDASGARHELSEEGHITSSRASKPRGRVSAKITASATSDGSPSCASPGGRYCSARVSKNAVRIPPGTSSVTPTSPASSAASARVNPMTPNLLAQ